MEEHFWSIAIETGWVQASIWNIRDKTANVVTISPAVPWSNDEDLVAAADSALSSAVQTLADSASEPSKSVFGVPPSWVSEGQIKKEHLEKIRLLCGKLSLEPSGFVVLPEAIAHYKKSQENAPISAVIIGTSKDMIDVTLFRLGNLVGTVNVGRSVSIIDDVIEGLARFKTAEPIPSRFLLYDGKSGELEEVKQNLIKADWSEFKEQVNFLHTPQVEIVEPEEKMIAVSLAGAAEIGQASVVAFNAAGDEKERKAESIQNVGAEEVTPEALGFTVGESPKVNLDLGEKANEIKKSLPRFTLNFSKFLKHRPNFNLSKVVSGIKMKGEKSYIAIMAVAGIVFLVGLAAWWFLPKADISLFISPKKIEKRETIVFDTKADSLDVSKKIVPAKTVTIQEKGEKTRSTTGTKTIGERAKGKVTVRNGTGNNIGLSSGTVLVGPNNLRFTVESSASVSAAVSPTTPGTGSVAITATEIGPEYNLAKGEILKVGNFAKTEVDAIVDSDLSGGTSREVVAVGKEDQAALEKDLTEELTENGQSNLEEKIDEEEILIDSSFTATASARTFSHKLGEEATTVKLSETVNISGLTASRSDLYTLARELVKNQVPTDFAVKDDQIEIEFSAKGETTFIINLLPQIKPDEIAKKIAGKYPKVAQNYLNTIAGFVRAEIRMNPSLPGPLGVLPHIPGNITVEVSAEK